MEIMARDDARIAFLQYLLQIYSLVYNNTAVQTTLWVSSEAATSHVLHAPFSSPSQFVTPWRMSR